MGIYSPNIVVAAADGAIAIPSSQGGQQTRVFITKGTAAALTLASPISGEDDGKVISIVSTTAAAHTVTNATDGFNAGGSSKDVATFGAAIGNNMQVVAYGGFWHVVSQVGITLA